MHTLTRLAVAAAAFAWLAGAAQAHEAWLKPSSTVLSKPDWITVDAAVSTGVFFFDHVPLNTDGLQITAPDGSTLAPENVARGKLRNVFDLHLDQPGTYRIAVVNGGVSAFYKDKATGQPRRWRGDAATLASDIPADAQDLRVTESAGRVETFATVGKPSPLAPIGKGLELVPLTPLADLAQGEAARFALRLDGQPAAGVAVTVVREGTRYRDQVEPIRLTTGADGSFGLSWPQAGLYRLEARATDQKTTTPLAKERRLNYAATLEVLP